MSSGAVESALPAQGVDAGFPSPWVPSKSETRVLSLLPTLLSEPGAELQQAWATLWQESVTQRTETSVVATSLAGSLPWAQPGSLELTEGSGRPPAGRQSASDTANLVIPPRPVFTFLTYSIL